MQVLLFTPVSAPHVFRGTWDNVFGYAASVYPGACLCFDMFLVPMHVCLGGALETRVRTVRFVLRLNRAVHLCFNS